VAEENARTTRQREGQETRAHTATEFNVVVSQSFVLLHLITGASGGYVANLMNVPNPPRIKKYPFRKGSFARVYVGRNPNVSLKFEATDVLFGELMTGSWWYFVELDHRCWFKSRSYRRGPSST
jgi:hypothetical protein